MSNIYKIILLLLCFFTKKHSDHERNTLKAEKYVFYSKKIRRVHRFAFLTDLHEKEFGRGNEELVKMIREFSPDFVLIGGDMVICRKKRGLFTTFRFMCDSFLAGISSSFSNNRQNSNRSVDSIENTIRLIKTLKKQYPLYAALGNHEERLFEKAGIRKNALFKKHERNAFHASFLPLTCQKWNLNASGIESKDESLVPARAENNFFSLMEALEGCTLLDSETVFPSGSLSDLSISGVSLPIDYYQSLLFKNKQPLDNRQYLRFSGMDKWQKPAPDKNNGQKFNICLLHSPFYYKEAIRNGADLVLSGHFHGGTIRIPGIGALMTPQFRFFVKECAGVFRYKKGSALISRGLGTHSINIRINDYPELSLVELIPSGHGTING